MHVNQTYVFGQKFPHATLFEEEKREGGRENIIPLLKQFDRRSAARAAQGCSVSVSFDTHHTKKDSGCSGTTGRSAARL